MPSLPVPVTLSLPALSHSVQMPRVRAPASKCLRLFLIFVCTDPSFLLFSSKFLRNYHCLPVPSSCLLFFLFFFFSFLVLEIRPKVFGMPRKYPATVLHHQSLGPPTSRPFSFETKSCQLPRLTFNLRSSNLGFLSMHHCTSLLPVC